MSSPLKIDIVVPIYNEETVIADFHARLISVLDALPHAFRVIYIDDGSTDKTLEQVIDLVRADRRIVLVELARNFGHQAALLAGLNMADGDYVITMDGDGQHPPSLLPDLINLAMAGYDIVQTHRLDQEGETLPKRWTSKLFYRLINFIGTTHLEPGGADFRIMNARAVLALHSLPEYHIFLRGMIAWMGFRVTVLRFQPEKRIAGESKYSFNKMVRLAMEAIFSFSLIPLYMALILGVVFLGLALFEAAYVLSFWVMGRASILAPGWASLMFVLLCVGSCVLFILGIIGIYIGYIFQEVKHRPIFLIRRLHNFSEVIGGKTQ